jgi:hypothetical protein
VNTTDVAVELTAVAAVPPTVTLVAPVRFEPASVTTLPAVNGPIVTFKLIAAGGGINVNADARATDEPPGPVTTSVTAPAACSGVVTVRVVGVCAVTVASVPPKVAPVASPRFVPVMTTLVPPPVDPAMGVSDVTVGTRRS